MLQQICVIALAVLALTWGLRLVLDLGFELALEHRYWLRDYLGNLVLALFCFALIRRVGGTLVLAGFLIIFFQMSNGLKLTVLGTPASPDDFINFQNLFFLVEGWPRILMGLVLLIPIALFLYLTRWKAVSSWVVFGGLAGVIGFVLLNAVSVRIALDKQFGNSVWNQPENFKRRGLGLHLVQESVRTYAKVGKVPSAQAVSSVMQGLPLAAADTGALDKRNVHMILLESFFDPVSLGSEWVPEDPFPPEFRELWAQTGNSTALSPVFGGYTANAEFEALCGFPVTENAVFFEGWLRQASPCLPNTLREAGFRTVASHPNVPGFWNRTHAYQLTGFDEYLSKGQFDLSDSVGNFLLDHSYYEQVFEQLGPLDQGPVFNYMLTYHGHLPYPDGPGYPDKVQSGREDETLLNGYLNHLWYKSRDLMAELDRLRAADPDALIIAFGDHLPFLRPNYGVYDEHLGLPSDRKEFTAEMLEFLVQTPLIVIDGQRGPLELGKVPLYRLPSLVIELLGGESGGMLDWTENPDGSIIRPVYGMHIRLDANGGPPVACQPDGDVAAGCEESSNWMARTRTLIADIFTGKQHSLSKLPANADS